MSNHLRANLWLLVWTLALSAVLYPLVVLGIGKVLFPDRAEGSLLTDKQGTVVGSRLIGQNFTKDEYFQPRPSSAGVKPYNAAYSGASNWAGNNYLLRDRVAQSLGPIVRYRDNPTKLAGEDVEKWFQDKNKELVRAWLQDKTKPAGIVALWAQTHPSAAQAWVKASDDNKAYVANWVRKHPEEVKLWKANPANQGEPNPEDLADRFWVRYAEEDAAKAKGNPDKAVATFPSMTQDPGEEKKTMKRVTSGSDIQAFFFDLWLQEHPNVKLLKVPSDMVMASGSGLDPDITLENAEYQLKWRVADARVQLILETDPAVAKLKEEVGNEKDEAKRKQLEANLEKAKEAVRRKMEAKIGKPLKDKVTEVIQKHLNELKGRPLGGLVGNAELVNVLELNLALDAETQQIIKEYQ